MRSKRPGSATSYTLCLPVWYRATDETEWHTGLSQKITTTGALIRADEPGTPPSDLIVAIELPSAGGCLVGYGHVIRLIGGTDDTAPVTFAVQVAAYRLDRRDAVLSAPGATRLGHFRMM